MLLQNRHHSRPGLSGQQANRITPRDKGNGDQAPFCGSRIAVGSVTEGPLGVSRTCCQAEMGGVGKQRSAALMAEDPLSLGAVTGNPVAEFR